MTIARIRRHLPALGLALAVGLAARLLWIAFVRPDPAYGYGYGAEELRRFDDTVWYRGAAHFFAHGDGYVNPFSGTPTAAWPPGYPVFLGTIFNVFGEGPNQTYVANVALAVIAVALVYAIALQLFDARTAAVAALAAALWPGQVYFTSLTLSEPLFTVLFLLGVLLALRVPAAGRWAPSLFIVLGLAIGVATLTRGQGLLLLPLAVVAWAFAGVRWRRAIPLGILAALVVGVVLAPWVARNQRQLGSPVIIATNLGPNLWLGHHEGASGRMGILEPEPPQPSREGRTQGEFEVAADRLALREGLSFMFTHPADEVRLSLTKVRAMYESDATALDWNSGYRHGYYWSDNTELALRRAANGFWFAMLTFAVLGLVAARRRLLGPLAVLPLLVVAWTATHLLFFGDSRFHYPIVFVFAVLGANGLLTVFDALRRPRAILEKRYAAA